MPELLIQIYIFIIGACVGSFLNVCIYRLPAHRSVVRPASSCPSCSQPIRFYDNIPILSYLLLRGRCRNCGTRISFRYVCVEALTGIGALAVFFKSGLSFQALILFLFLCVLIVITYIDLDHKIIPNRITLPGIPLFLMASLAFPELRFKDALLGVIAGGGSLYAVAWGYKAITKKDGMGGGDIKLLAMMGSLIGWQGVIFTIYLASALGTLVGLPVMIFQKKNMKYAIPFGPFLAIGGLTYLFFGEPIIQWYYHLLQG